MKSIPTAMQIVTRAIQSREKTLMDAGSFDRVSGELLDELARLYAFRDSVQNHIEALKFHGLDGVIVSDDDLPF